MLCVWFDLQDFPCYITHHIKVPCYLFFFLCSSYLVNSTLFQLSSVSLKIAFRASLFNCNNSVNINFCLLDFSAVFLHKVNGLSWSCFIILKRWFKRVLFFSLSSFSYSVDCVCKKWSEGVSCTKDDLETSPWSLSSKLMFSFITMHPSFL